MDFKNSTHAQIDLTKEVPFIRFPVLSDIPFLGHGFSTRLGGVSSGIYSSMNLGSDSAIDGDHPDNIKKNFERIANSIGFDPKTIVISKQVHKTNILRVDAKDCGKGLYRERDFDEIDGLITNTPEVTLVTKYADCVPLYFVDQKRKAIGLTHSGWRGTVNKIGKITINRMQEEFGSDPKDIIAVIGPSICKTCYEIGEEVAQEFKKNFPLNHEKNILEAKGKGKYLCDLWAANRLVLMEAGLEQKNIHTSGVCTSCHDELLFSHRKTGGKRGSLAAFLLIKKQ
ncbi:MAG: peptidoglycan editing factor PgeF [Clostridiales bacterium]|jgi:YfiH family protein|nr:peptidoglycan editing factor PgeF [Clostridiales bacterium]